jgi:membrane protein YdbS with pleckstrin-like domain
VNTGANPVYGAFAFDRGPLRRYWLSGAGALFAVLGAGLAIPTLGLSLLLVPVAVVFCWLWIQLVFMRLYYEVDEDSVNIRAGVLVHVEKVIPLEKITDIRLVQGPLMRCFGVCNVYLQTAGSSAQVPEAIMVFESHAKAVEVRERIMTARQRFRSSLLGSGTGDD